MKIFLAFSFILFYLFIGTGYAENPDSLKLLHIPEVCVFQSRQSLFKDDKFITTFDSITLLKNQNNNLGEILLFTEPILIHQYGASGSLSTISFRGTGANHTQVNWNGFPINAIGTEQMDLSLIGSDLANQIQLIHGASGAMYGNGTFGGALDLNNVPNWNNKLMVKFNSEVGSFDNNIDGNTFIANPGKLDSKKYSLKINAGSDRIQYSIYGFDNNTLNKFNYIDDDNIVPQNHNQFESRGIIQLLNYKVSPSQQIEVGLWAQQKHYQVPDLSKSTINANQNDSTFKSYAKWNYNTGASSYSVKTGYFYDYLHYTDLLLDIATGKPTNSKNGSRRWYNDLNYRNRLSENTIVDVGMSFLRTISINTNFKSLVIDENSLAFYGTSKYNISNLILIFSFRQEFVTGYNPLPQFSLGENWKLNKTFTLKSNISNKYRVPSFNEKYWIKDGKGNPNLKPENGIGFDAGIETNFKFASIINKLRTSIYSNSIKNWIQWVPVNTIYTAQNYQQVWTRGFEGAFDQTITFGKNGISWCIKYNYTPSTIEKSEDQQLIGKQLIYVPYHSATFNFNLKIHTANVGFDCNARSQSYSNAAQQGLPDNGFYIINCTINNTFLLKTHNFRIDLKINNLLDKQYYTYLPAYPMPGRAFYISFTYIFNKL